jgi:hypothetical protein
LHGVSGILSGGAGCVDRRAGGGGGLITGGVGFLLGFLAAGCGRKAKGGDGREGHDAH